MLKKVLNSNNRLEQLGAAGAKLCCYKSKLFIRILNILFTRK